MSLEADFAKQVAVREALKSYKIAVYRSRGARPRSSDLFHIDQALDRIEKLLGKAAVEELVRGI